MAKVQHFLKANQAHFASVFDGLQLCTIRVNDRNFKVGDEVLLMEWVNDRATGATIVAVITHIQTGFGLVDGFVALSIN